MPKNKTKKIGDKVMDAIRWPCDKLSALVYGNADKELDAIAEILENNRNDAYQRGYRDGQAAHCHRHSRLFTHRHKKHHGHHHTHGYRASPSKQ